MRNRLLRLAAYALVGVAAGLLASGIEWLTISVLLDHLSELDLWAQAIGPTVGLIIAAGLLRWLGRGLTPSTSEEYIRAYHERRPVTRLRDLPSRLLAGCFTIGLGGTMGLEGPSIYAGSTVGASIQHRLAWLFAGKHAKMLLVAGAAAGVAAIFKTPATGVLFALEAPYLGDVARRSLLPALIASATSYITFITIWDTRPIFPAIGGSGFLAGFGRSELVGAVAIGLLAAVGAVVFARLVKWAKRIQSTQPLWLRIGAAGIVLAGLAVFTNEVAGEPLTIGPGVPVFDWVREEPRAIWLLLVVLAARMLGTTATMAGGGAGGLFFPLAVCGILVGDLVADLLDLSFGPTRLSASTFFASIGIAAFLGAGYRTPLAAVMFVAESTGETKFVVPALIAVAVSQVVVGRNSVSSFQTDTRVGHLERRFGMPIASVLQTEVDTVTSDATVSDYFWMHALAKRQLSSVVVDDGSYAGLVQVSDAVSQDRDTWSITTVAEIMRRDVRPARLSWTLREATAAIEEHDLDQLPVVDAGGRLVGVVTQDDILRLDELLEETEG